MSQNRNKLPLFFSMSTQSTVTNKTGTWRFSRPVYEEKTAPCSASCPAGEDIARIEMMVSQGHYKKAWETIIMENPFPAISGRVCFHPCEQACNRATLDNAIAIHHLERFIGDLALKAHFQCNPLCASKPGNERIAIAGAGPAGLSAAAFLTRLGYTCHVFEASEEPGGLMRWGIPDYRLPKNILTAEINRLKEWGVKIQCGEPVGENCFEDLQKHYKALVITCGYGKPIQLEITGSELSMHGLKLLEKIASGKQLPVSGSVAVIGGGNTAVDVARSLLRMGAKPEIVYRRRKADMPSFHEETQRAINENIPLKALLAPLSIHKKGNRLSVVLQPMEIDRLYPDQRARVLPKRVPPETVSYDAVVMAIGATPAKTWLSPPKGLNGTIRMPHCTIVNPDFPTVFGGDLTNPIKSVTDAIASGKAAAIALDTYFTSGWHEIESRLNASRVADGPALSMETYLNKHRQSRNRHVVSFSEINTDYFEPEPRNEPPEADLNFTEPFAETIGTFSESNAMKESSRCFNCGICNDCDNCRVFCPELAVTVDHSREINLDYCKGCGICAVECPRNAISLKGEKP